MKLFFLFLHKKLCCGYSLEVPLTSTHKISCCGEVRKISTIFCLPGPSCSKITMSLVNDLLKFKSSDTQYADIFC